MTTEASEEEVDLVPGCMEDKTEAQHLRFRALAGVASEGTALAGAVLLDMDPRVVAQTVVSWLAETTEAMEAAMAAVVFEVAAQAS